METDRKLAKPRRAPRNRTLTLLDEERDTLRDHVTFALPKTRLAEPIAGTVCGDFLQWTSVLPAHHVDLLFLDPPYNLDKEFNGRKFLKTNVSEYTEWLDDMLAKLKPLLKPTATIYICGDWLTSQSIYLAASNHFVIQNRITWEREKGRGAKRNWKNTTEDIWFCTLSNEYTFNVDDVKLRRRVIAPYKDKNGKPKDWNQTGKGNFRDTHPSNLWTDISIPFWSMPENTDHPTQKSEKLLAKLILASTNQNDFVLDPFLGSGTTSVVAKKLRRQFLGIEIDEDFCLLAAKRLLQAETNQEIQGFSDGVFWERNSLSQQKASPKNSSRPATEEEQLF